MRMTQTYQICCTIFIGVLCSTCHCITPQQTVMLPQSQPRQQDVVLIQDNIRGTSSSGIGLIPFPLLLPLLTSVVMMMPTMGPDGTMMPIIQAVMMPPQQPAPIPTTPTPLPQTTPCVPRTCMTGYVQVNNKCYLYVTTAASWGVANVRCIAGGARLWEPTTLAEYNAVRTQFNLGMNVVWTGANDIVTGGDVRFQGSNNPFNTPFGTVSPMNMNNMVRDCVNISTFNNAQTWRFSDCDSGNRYICEYAVFSVRINLDCCVGFMACRRQRCHNLFNNTFPVHDSLPYPSEYLSTKSNVECWWLNTASCLFVVYILGQ